jgi:hypothetical protein
VAFTVLVLTTGICCMLTTCTNGERSDHNKLAQKTFKNKQKNKNKTNIQMKNFAMTRSHFPSPLPFRSPHDHSCNVQADARFKGTVSRWYSRTLLLSCTCLQSLRIESKKATGEKVPEKSSHVISRNFLGDFSIRIRTSLSAWRRVCAACVAGGLCAVCTAVCADSAGCCVILEEETQQSTHTHVTKPRQTAQDGCPYERRDTRQAFLMAGPASQLQRQHRQR